jgi:hypothetical protein
MRQAFTGPGNPVWKRRQERKCLGCGAILVIGNLSITKFNKKKYCTNRCQRGTYTSSWKGGKLSRSDGYIIVYQEGKRHGFEHRLKAEKALGRPLKRTEIVHHVNCDKADNRNNNLLICDNAYHQWLHGEMARRWINQPLPKLEAGWSAGLI